MLGGKMIKIGYGLIDYITNISLWYKTISNNVISLISIQIF